MTRVLLAALAAGLIVAAPPPFAPRTTCPLPRMSVLSICPTAVSLPIGATQRLVAFAGGDTVTATWVSSNPAVAQVTPGGIVTALAAGSATITATAGSLTGSAAITTTPVPPSAVTDLKATAQANGTGITLSWTDVANGAGSVANYNIRYAIGSTLTWGSTAPDTHWTDTTAGQQVGSLNGVGTCSGTTGGKAATEKGISVGAARGPQVINATPGTTYTFQMVGFRAAAPDTLCDATIVFGPLSNSTTVSTPIIGTAADTIIIAFLGPYPKTVSLPVGGTVQLCVFFQFQFDVAERTQDRPQCDTLYAATFSAAQRVITTAQQAVADKRCVVWSSSNGVVAAISNGPC
jgi:Bacterial Ig-like domain (group 2)